MLKKLLALTLGALLITTPVSAAPAFVNSVGADSIAPGSGIPATPAVDFTGVTQIIICTDHAFGSGTAPTDSTSANTYTHIGTTATAGSFVHVEVWASQINPTVTSSMTFTDNDTYDSIAVMGFSGMTVSSNFDQGASGTSATSPVNSGSITPTQNNEVLISCLGVDGTAAPLATSVDSSYTKIWTSVASNSEILLAASYKIQTTAATTSPNWTYANTAASAARVLSFKSGGAGPTAVNSNLLTLGVGQ